MAYQQNNYPFKKVEWPRKRKKKKNKNQYTTKSKGPGGHKKKKKKGVNPEAIGLATVLGGLGAAIGLTTYKGGLDSRTPGKWKNP